MANGASELSERWRRAHTILLRNVVPADPGADDRGSCDLRIEGGILTEIAPNLSGDSDLTADFSGSTVLPGLFDMHVHLREPGGEESETILTGALAAARGGFTGVACMPNTKIRIDTRAVIDFVHSRAREACGTKIHPVAAMTMNLEGKHLAEMAELKESGAVAVSDDGLPVSNSEVCRRAMEYARMCGLPVLAHCEDLDLRGKGVMHEGYWSSILGLRGIPAAAEEIGVARDLALAELTGCRLHLCHVSTAGSVQLLRRAREKGLPVTAETAPHYLCLTDENLRGFDSSFKMNPPLRGPGDVEAVREAVLDGTIDCIATDHAPHAHVLKDVELDQAPFGVIGLETSFGVCHKVLVEQSGMPLSTLVDRMSIAPRRVLGLAGGRLQIGKPADLTVIDLNWEWTVESSHFASLGRNCPFQAWTLKGKVLLTIADGTVTHAAVSPSGSSVGPGPGKGPMLC